MSTPAPAFEQRDIRLSKRQALLDAHKTPYALAKEPTWTITQIRQAFPDIEPGAETDTLVTVAGRVVFSRNGGKLCFMTLQAGDGSRLQVMVGRDDVGVEALTLFKSTVDIGDHVLVNGNVNASLRGELSVRAHSVEVISKAVRPLPNLHDGLNEETRVRQRYLDLIASDSARDMVRMRAAVNRSIRRSLEDYDFIEVETPMLQTQPGGASARPFITHSNALGDDLYLRIAPELFLKRCIIGGIERVFEINRNFRNEGMDSTHSPEFAMLEFYQTYANYQQMATRTQAIILAATLTATGSSIITLGEIEYDLADESTWRRISMYGSLSEYLGENVSPQTSLSELMVFADMNNVRVGTADASSAGKLAEHLWENLVLPRLGNAPTFVFDYPQDTSPLVSPHPEVEGAVQKWDLYVGGFELATGYTELSDPVIQREQFVRQAAARTRGDEEAMVVDEEFLTAMEHGMPPCGGVGMGIDRLLMMLTGKGIRETILFPLIKATD